MDNSKQGLSSRIKSPFLNARFQHWIGGVLVEMRRKSPVQQWVDSIGPQQTEEGSKSPKRTTSHDDISVTSESCDISSVKVDSDSESIKENNQENIEIPCESEHMERIDDNGVEGENMDIPCENEHMERIEDNGVEGENMDMPCENEHMERIEDNGVEGENMYMPCENEHMERIEDNGVEGENMDSNSVSENGDTDILSVLNEIDKMHNGILNQSETVHTGFRSSFLDKNNVRNGNTIRSLYGDDTERVYMYSISMDNDALLDDDLTRNRAPLLRDRSVNSEGNSPKHKNALRRDSSLQSDTSRASSVESLLEARKVDAEAVLRGVGFGPNPAKIQLARIPDRFLRPSKLKGVDTEQFIKDEQKSMKLHECGVFGYKGLTGDPHAHPSNIVAKIIERISSREDMPEAEKPLPPVPRSRRNTNTY